MFNLTTDETGKKPGSWINPIENVIEEEPLPEPEPDEEEEDELPDIEEVQSWITIIFNLFKKLADLLIKLYKKEKNREEEE